jgi:anthranilate/para-aminobenzoate synthase component I
VPLALPYVRLDSPARPGEELVRWSFPPGTPDLVVTCDSPTHAFLRTPDGIEDEWDDPLDALRWMTDRLAVSRSPDMRWVGYLSYDLGRLFETIPARAVDDLGLPLFRFSLQYRGEGELPRDLGSAPAPPPAAVPHSTFTRGQYLDAVARAIEYIAAGDVFQVNLSQRFSTPLCEHPAKLYARLRRQSPAWYGACLCYDDFAILSNSPELFLRVDPQPDGTRRVVTRPIKGTRPRAAGMDAELRDSPKDQAELNMIVDLERNDLGRVCEIGSVRVTEPRSIEAHPTVYHGVATVEGVLRGDVSLVDLLRATFPGGSVTGAPKIRAMEIIEELEPVCRGPYCGAIGYLGGDGSIEFNVAIRTMTARDGLVHVPVGGGIVADSDPAAEYEETLVKAKAMFAALGISADDVETLGRLR